MKERDNQRQKVYNWEHANIPGWPASASSPPVLSLEECEALIKRICADYRASVPVIKDGRRNRNASAGAYIIKLPRWSRFGPVVLHEMAHVILNQKAPSVAGHGPEFMRLYLDLLAKYAKLPLRELRSSAAKAGLQVATSCKCPQPQTPEEKRLRAVVNEARKSYDDARAALHEYLKSKKSQ